jgi:hypothetical protein
MFRPSLSLLDPSYSLDTIARRFGNSLRLRENLLGGMDVNLDVVEKMAATRCAPTSPA